MLRLLLVLLLPLVAQAEEPAAAAETAPATGVTAARPRAPLTSGDEAASAASGPQGTESGEEPPPAAAAEPDAAAALEQAARAEAEARTRAAREAAAEEERRAEEAARALIGGERTRVEQARADLATHEATLLAALRTEADAPPPAPAADLEPDARYDALVELLKDRRAQLSLALDQLREGSGVPAFEPQLDLDAPQLARLPAERRVLREAYADLTSQAARLRDLEGKVRWARVDRLAAEVQALNAERLAQLRRVSPAKHDRLLSLGRDGIAQLLREVEHLRVSGRAFAERRMRDLLQLPAKLGDVATAGSAAVSLLQLLLLAVLTTVLVRRIRSWLDALRRGLGERLRSRQLRRAVVRWLGLLAAISAEVVLLVALVVARDIAGDLVPELQLAFALAIGWAWYRLLMAFAYRAITQAARRELSLEVRARVLRTIQRFGRYALAVYALLVVSAAVLGRGYLHRFTVDFAWIGVLPVGLVVLRDWSGDIADAYLEASPQGWLAPRLQKGGVRGLLAAGLAVGGVAARGIGGWLRRSALEFEQTRKALAFLFRRRMEKHAGAVGRGAVDVSGLPQDLRLALTEQVATPELCIERFPGLEGVVAQLAATARGEGGASLALVGERGAGKSTWLAALERRAGPLTHVMFVERVLDERALCHVLGEALELPGEDTAAGMVNRLRRGEPRCVVLDGCESLFLRCVGGTEAFDALVDVAGRTAGKVTWVSAFSRHAFDHLRALYPGQALFREVIDLGAWAEDEISTLLDRRLRSAGYEASYEDLLVDRLEGTAVDDEVIRTAGSYHRLLWDYSDGNPRVALHFWLRSLVPDGERRVRVRLFDAPDATELEALPEQSRFLLGAVLVHVHLTAAEAARVLRWPAASCEAGLSALRTAGYLEEAGGRFRVTTRWMRTCLRFLRRKRLVP